MTNSFSVNKRFRAALNHRQADRIPMIETLIWPETLTRWYDEGLPRDIDVSEFFGLDCLKHFFGIYDHTLMIEPQVIKQTDDYIIKKNRYGAVHQYKKNSYGSSTLLSPSIKTREDWDRLKENLYVAEERITDKEAIKSSVSHHKRGDFVTIETIEPLWFVLNNTMGYEHGLLTMACEPELFEEIISTYADFSIRMLDLCFSKGFYADALWFFSDLCYKNGLLFSPDSFRSLVAPHLKQFKEFCDKHGMYFFWHCDGNVSELIPLLQDIGVDAIHPLEARAGNDVREYKERFGNSMCFIGNVNADIVATGDKAAIESEVAQKVTVAKKGGGYIYNIDHSVPPTVSLESYKFLLEMVRKYGQY